MQKQHNVGRRSEWGNSRSVLCVNRPKVNGYIRKGTGSCDCAGRSVRYGVNLTGCRLDF